MAMQAFMCLREMNISTATTFFGGEIIFPFIHIGDGGLVLEDEYGGNFHKGHIGYEELRPLSLYLGVLDHVDVLGDAHGVTIIGDHFGGDINNIERMKASATHL